MSLQHATLNASAVVLRRGGAVEAHAEVVPTKGKHKYALPLDDLIRELVNSRSNPYPKRQKDSSEPSP